VNFAELLLRLGCALVGWLIVFTHILWLATSRVVECGSDGDEFWRLLLAFAPVAIAFGFLLPLTRKIAGVHQTLRWAAAPLALISPLAMLAVIKIYSTVNLAGAGICSAEPASWHSWWAPVQGIALIAIGILAWRAFKAAPALPH
jgi:hypothetical protein